MSWIKRFISWVIDPANNQCPWCSEKMYRRHTRHCENCGGYAPEYYVEL